VPLEPERSNAPLSAPDSYRESRDRAWVESIRTGDVPAFEAMFRAYKNDLGAFVTSWVHSREAAEEVIQDLFLHLWEQRHEWQPAVPLNIYLFRAARNRAIDHLRHQRVEAEFQERIARRRDAGFEPRAPVRGDEAAQAAELEDAIERAVSTLPPRCQEVFRLSRYHHLSYAEVALVMQISTKTVEVQMGRALTALRSCLAAWRD
jgi:RNA polymerase sigma-70 factor (ECF subfamily)